MSRIFQAEGGEPLSDRPQIHSQDRLIEAAYEVAVSPDTYDQFLAQWEQYLGDMIETLDGAPQSELSIAPMVASHLRRSLEILDRLGRPEAKPEDASAVARARIALLHDGRIVDCNDLATDLFACEIGGLVFNLEISPDSENRLRDRLAGTADGGAEELFLFFGGVDGHPSPMALHPRPDTEQVFELVGLHNQWAEHHDEALRQMFGLSNAELRLARDLLTGVSLKEIAEISGRSLETLRTQLKAIRRKTFTANQQQLVRIMTGMENLGPRASKSHEEPDIQVMRLPDGRVMQVRICGPRDGTPVLFLHNMLNGPNLPVECMTLLHEFGLRCIAPWRPCFGLSDPDPVACETVSLAPDRLAGDLSFLLQKLGIMRVVVVGHMSGALYGFRLAQLRPDLVAGVYAIAGGVPIKRMRQILSMTRRQRVLALTARLTPRILPSLLRAGTAQLDSGDAGVFLDALYPEGSPDHVATRIPEIRENLIQGIRETVRQGHLGFEIDAHHVVRDWSRYCDHVSQPVRLIHGTRDGVVSIESARAFSRRSNFEFSEIPEGGQLLLHLHARRVMADLAAFAACAGDARLPSGS